MLKVLTELEKLAASLDSKKQYKFADEVEKVMQEVVKYAQERLPEGDIPETVPELQAAGDPYEYGYLVDRNSFVVTSPRGRGTVIEQGGKYDASWKALQARLPDSIRSQQSVPSASGPVAEIDHRAEYAKRAIQNLIVQFKSHVLSGAYGHEIEMAAGTAGMNIFNKAMSSPESFTPRDALALGPYVKKMLASSEWPTEKAPYRTIGGLRQGDNLSGHPNQSGAWEGRFSLDELFARLEELAAQASGSGSKSLASKSDSDLKKEASANLVTSMEVAFHNPSRTPFGR